jgi:uracil-DNA glycosylase
MSSLFNTLTPTWQEALAPQEDKIRLISTYLDSNPYIPSRSKIFAALTIDPRDVKVVIIGQDPYPNPSNSMGLSFSVPTELKTLPASLKNIFKELHDDLGILNTSGDLTPWKDQGVLLLNTILTTTPGKSLSHDSIGWQEITNEIIKVILPANPVVLLWGNKAIKLSALFNPELTITSSHPSPLSARHSFIGSKPFSRANKMLIASNRQPIDWQT